MMSIAVVGCILGWIAAADPQLLAELLPIIMIPAVVIIIPAHYAIEANRHDSIRAELREASRHRQGRPPGPG